MQEVTAKKITMQTNFLNNLIEDRSTPKGKIKIELMMLNHLLENYDAKRSNDTRAEKEQMQEALKKAKENIDKINSILED